jgi:hypothetical protein
MRYLLILVLSFNLYANSKMVFLIEEGDKKHVGLQLEGQKDFKYLTFGNQWHIYPTISSDGNLVAYAKGDDEKSLSLTLHDLRTGNLKSLTRPGYVVHPSFCNNGERIFFSEKVNGLQKIGYIDHKRNSGIQYIDEDMDAYFPAPFQNCERLVYQRNNNGLREIVLMDLTSNKKEVIAKGMSPSLSKDEKYIAFTSDIDGSFDIYLYDRFSKKTIQVTNDKGREFSPHFDRLGNLLFTSDKHNDDVFAIYKREKSELTQTNAQNTIVHLDQNISFYAPRVSGKGVYTLRNLERMIGNSRSSFGAITHKGKVYVVGGHQGAEHTYPPESFTGVVNVYDIKRDFWKELAPRPTLAHGFQLAAWGDYIYAFGGFAYDENNNPKWKSLNIVERYNIERDRWEFAGFMPRRRSSNVVVQIDHLVYLIGGWDATPRYDGDKDGYFHDKIDLYSLKTGRWYVLKAKLPKKRRAFNHFVKDGMVYLLGGISEGGSHFTLSDDFTQFDPVTRGFKEMPKLPFGTFAPASGTLGNFGYMFGGMFQTGKRSYEYIPHIYEFDFTKNKWSHTGRYLKEYKGFSQVVELEGCLGILGGHSYDGQIDEPVKSFEKFCLGRN